MTADKMTNGGVQARRAWLPGSGYLLPARNALTDDGYWSAPFAVLPHERASAPDGATHYRDFIPYARPPLVIASGLDPLKERPCWVTWMHGTATQTGRRPKIPLNPHKQGAATAQDAGTWGMFEEAMHRYRDCQPKPDGSFSIAGVGVMMTKDDPFFCIDVDLKRLPATHPVRGSWWRLLRGLDSHVHNSPSGQGFHLFGLVNDAALLDKLGASQIGLADHIDLFSFDSFVTITDATIIDGPLRDITETVRGIVEDWEQANGKPISERKPIIEDSEFEPYAGDLEPLIAKLKTYAPNNRINWHLFQDLDALAIAFPCGKRRNSGTYWHDGSNAMKSLIGWLVGVRISNDPNAIIGLAEATRAWGCTSRTWQAGKYESYWHRQAVAMLNAQQLNDRENEKRFEALGFNRLFSR